METKIDPDFAMNILGLCIVTSSELFLLLSIQYYRIGTQHTPLTLPLIVLCSMEPVGPRNSDLSRNVEIVVNEWIIV